MNADDLDLDSRRLCPDGACIGVIGDDGRCRVCGLADDGSVQAPVTREMEASTIDLGAGGDGGGDAFEGEDRELCPDGACIGVIGSDGRCKVCGRPRGS
jgi:hypothetical protein